MAVFDFNDIGLVSSREEEEYQSPLGSPTEGNMSNINPNPSNWSDEQLAVIAAVAAESTAATLQRLNLIPRSDLKPFMKPFTGKEKPEKLLSFLEQLKQTLELRNVQDEKEKIKHLQKERSKRGEKGN